MEDIRQIIIVVKRASALIRQILEFSRRGKPALQALRPHLILEEVLPLLRASLPTTIEMVVDIDPDCGVVRADPSQLHQVIMNLCTNAFRAMEGTKGVLAICLSRQEKIVDGRGDENGETAHSYVVLTVRDTGKGMAPDIVSRIFEPYFTTSVKGKGCGLGLAVVHGIIKGYNGFIEVESTVGEGSAFHVYIPALKEGALVSEIREMPEMNLMGKEHILVVDDEPLLVKIHQRILEDYGYTVTGMTDSREALKKVLAEPELFDLVITDQTMPGLTGDELASAILKVAPVMPIILCSGHSDLFSPEKVFSLGIKKYLQKPMGADELVRTVRMVFNEQNELNV